MLTTRIGKIYYMDNLATRIRMAREAANMTPQDLAKAVGISRPAVVLWETGATKNVRLEHLFAAAKAMKVEPEWLATGNGHREVNNKKYEVEIMEDAAVRFYTCLYDTKTRVTPEQFQKMIGYIYMKEVEENPKLKKAEIIDLLRLVK